MIMSRVGARVLLLSIGMLLGQRSADAATIYVNAGAKPGAAHDGTSWKTAFSSLQDALDVAVAPSGPCTSLTQIWVAAGTYAPSKIYAPITSDTPAGVPGGKSGQNVP